MVCELTGLPVSNASLLDEATSAGESLYLSMNYHDFKRKKFFVQESIFPQTLEVIQTKAKYLNIEIEVGKPENLKPEEFKQYAGAIFQSPDDQGVIHQYGDLIDQLNQEKVVTILATDLL